MFDLWIFPWPTQQEIVAVFLLSPQARTIGEAHGLSADSVNLLSMEDYVDLEQGQNWSFSCLGNLEIDTRIH